MLKADRPTGRINAYHLIAYHNPRFLITALGFSTSTSKQDAICRSGHFPALVNQTTRKAAMPFSLLTRKWEYFRPPAGHHAARPVRRERLNRARR